MPGEISNQEINRRASTSRIDFEDNKPKTLLDQIKARRNDSNIIDDTNREPVKIQENIKLKMKLHKLKHLKLIINLNLC